MCHTSATSPFNASALLSHSLLLYHTRAHMHSSTVLIRMSVWCRHFTISGKAVSFCFELFVDAGCFVCWSLWFDFSPIKMAWTKFRQCKTKEMPCVISSIRHNMRINSMLIIITTSCTNLQNWKSRFQKRVFVWQHWKVAGLLFKLTCCDQNCTMRTQGTHQRKEKRVPDT